MPYRIRIAILIMAVLLGALASGLVAQEEDELDQKRMELRDWRVGELLKLAKSCKGKKYFSFAQDCIAEAEELNAEAENLADLKGAVEGKENDARLKPQVKDMYHAKYDKYRAGAAQRIADIGKWCRKNERDDAVAELVAEALALDEDCRAAHLLNGEGFVKGFGWVPAEDAAKMNKGFLKFEGEWKPRKEVEKLRAKWEHHWEIESKHWIVKSNIKLDRIFKQLEILELFYKSVRSDCEGQLPLREQTHKFKVFLFAKKSEYESYLQQHVPDAVQNREGQYSNGSQESYFFDVDSVDQGMGGSASSLQELMLHECTHQLFREMIQSNTGMVSGSPPCYWLHEGVAEYYSCMSEVKGKLVFDKRYIKSLLRIQMGKQRWSKAMPLTELDRNRRDEWNNAPDRESLEANYLQAMYLCLFFAERYPDQFRVLLKEAYCGSLKEGMIAEHINSDLNKLQKEVDAFVKKY